MASPASPTGSSADPTTNFLSYWVQAGAGRVLYRAAAGLPGLVFEGTKAVVHGAAAAVDSLSSVVDVVEGMAKKVDGFATRVILGEKAPGNVKIHELVAAGAVIVGCSYIAARLAKLAYHALQPAKHDIHQVKGEWLVSYSHKPEMSASSRIGEFVICGAFAGLFGGVAYLTALGWRDRVGELGYGDTGVAGGISAYALTLALIAQSVGKEHKRVAVEDDSLD